MMGQIIKRIVRSFIHPSQIHAVNPHGLIVQSISNYKILENIRRMGIVYKDRGPKLIGLSKPANILQPKMMRWYGRLGVAKRIDLTRVLSS